MIYQIHRYPADLIDVVRLGGRERVVIRPVLPQDEDLTHAFFRNLSAPARYDRFMTSLNELPPDLMRRFTQVDYANHLALVAEVFSQGRETVVAEARYVRLADNADAEFAVSVAEHWQGKGLARLMLGKLNCRAAAQGVARIVGTTLATNARMISLARKSGFTIRPSPDVHGLLLLEKALAHGRESSGAKAGALAA
ncbi:MAG: N-acetyltransferase family protein [Hyphomicrobiaceae bacterium]